MPRPRKPANLFRYFHSSLEVIRLVALMYVRFPLSLRNVEDLLFERGIDICHGTVRLWWNRFGPMFAADIAEIEEFEIAPDRFGLRLTHVLSSIGSTPEALESSLNAMSDLFEEVRASAGAMYVPLWRL